MIFPHPKAGVILGMSLKPLSEGIGGTMHVLIPKVDLDLWLFLFLAGIAHLQGRTK